MFVNYNRKTFIIVWYDIRYRLFNNKTCVTCKRARCIAGIGGEGISAGVGVTCATVATTRGVTNKFNTTRGVTGVSVARNAWTRTVIVNQIVL